MGCSKGPTSIEQRLGKLFYNYGHFLAKHPWPFLIMPLLTTSILALGILQINLVSDLEDLYVPVNAPSKSERALVQKLFPENDTHFFTFLRQTEIQAFLQVIITTHSEGNILTNETFEAIYQLDETLRNVQVHYDGRDYVFDDDICTKWMNDCEGNMLLDILKGKNVPEVSLTFPLHDGRYLLTSELLSVTTDDDNIVQSAKALSLRYHGRYLAVKDQVLTDAWLAQIKAVLQDYTSDAIVVVFQTSESLDEELENSVTQILPLFAVSYFILLNFAVFSTLMLDWVRAKPWVALGGEIAAAFGIVSALGLMSACGVPFVNVVGTMPFLIIGIGLDDLFIIISAWRYTDYTLSVPERVALTFQSAAVSITLTSVTDTLAFCVGSITTFKSVQLFCAYTGVAIVFAYIYTITFTGACLVFSGRREAQNKHCFTFKQIKPKSQSGETLKVRRLFCTGGIETQETENEKKLPDDGKQHDKQHDKMKNIQASADKMEIKTGKAITVPLLSVFLTDYFAPFILKVPVKTCVLVAYVTYLSVAIWGCSQLQEGLDPSSLAPDDSYLIPFYDKYFKHYASTYGAFVSVTVTEALDYTSTTVISQIDATIDKFQRSEQFLAHDSAVISWLDGFEHYLSLSSRSVERNVTSMTHLISILRTEFLPLDGFKVFSRDIEFNAGYTEIVSSRFFIQSKGSYSIADDRQLLVESRKIADECQLSVRVFSPLFIYFDQFNVILMNTMQNLAIAVGAMLLVSLFFIPSLVAVIWVTLTTISICTGVIGYMALWGVSLDGVSMISLVMCIGFSVDFAAHISYHFVTCKARNANTKAREALGQLGTPILQGTLSTILGVLILQASSTYIFRTFFKLVFLVNVFGFFHALFLLPVILSVLTCSRSSGIPDTDELQTTTPNVTVTHSASQDKQFNVMVISGNDPSVSEITTVYFTADFLY